MRYGAPFVATASLLLALTLPTPLQAGLLTNAPDTVLDTNYPDNGVSYATSIGDVNGDGYDDVIAGTNWGYVFLGSASGIASAGFESAVTELEGRAGSRNMAGAGDVNGDGYDDVIMGISVGYGAGCCQAEIWKGSSAGIVTAYHDHIYAGTAADGFTYSGPVAVAGVGDVNGDGYDDVVLTGTRTTVPYTSQSLAAIFHGSAAGIQGFLASPDTLITFAQGFAGPCAGAGDVNGDGYDDVIVGLLGSGGAAMVFHGSASGIASGDHGDTLLTSGYSGSDFGRSVAGAGDVNGDGFDDVIVGDPDFDGGAAFLYLGSASGIPDSVTLYSPTAIMIRPDPPIWGGYGYFGWKVAGTGDINGDGYDDVIVSAPYSQSGEYREGTAFVFLGSETGLASSSTDDAYAQIESNQPEGFLGTDVAGAGDVNGDGLADVIVVACCYDAGEPNEGAALVYLGQADQDGDRAPDASDNCRSRKNASQIDVDADGFGNGCDADFDGNGKSGIRDFGTFMLCFAHGVPFDSGSADDPTCSESDMTGDGAVGLADYALFLSEFGTPPGP